MKNTWGLNVYMQRIHTDAGEGWRRKGDGRNPMKESERKRERGKGISNACRLGHQTSFHKLSTDVTLNI